MYCSKCGNKIEEHANFCRDCGAGLNTSTHSYNYDYGKGYIGEEDFKKAYVGNNYDNIENGKFSIPMFFFGAYYLFYRKMWLYAFLWIAMIVGINIGSFIYDDNYFSFIPIILSIIMAFNFNKLYLRAVDKRVEGIKQKNLDKSSQEILEQCRKKGGVSVLAVILSVIFITIVVTFLLIGLIIDTVSKDIRNNKWIHTNSSNQLNYTVPEIFESGGYNSGAYQSFSYYETSDACYINIMNYKNYSNQTEEEYLKTRVSTNLGDQVSEIQTKNINGKIWKYVEVVSNGKRVYYYVAIHNEKIYQVQYTISKDDNKLCSNGYNNFINSLTFENRKHNMDTI